MIKLKAKTAKEARNEAKKYAPCKLHGYDTTGQCVYMTVVRAKGHKAPVATASIPDKKATSFVAIPEI